MNGVIRVGIVALIIYLFWKYFNSGVETTATAADTTNGCSFIENPGNGSATYEYGCTYNAQGLGSLEGTAGAAGCGCGPCGGGGGCGGGCGGAGSTATATATGHIQGAYFKPGPTPGAPPPPPTAPVPYSPYGDYGGNGAIV